MVVCKYFQQGACRYGQYCRFQHINNFGGNQANTNKPLADGKNIVLGVAEEVLAAERGGQWLLSCFGPLKEQPCIPGMEDVSPEEVRWEMYQAQKNGTVEQTKLQFQQLCQAMTAKREALKNPTHETAAMLEKLQKTNRDGAFGGKTTFALSAAQMGQPTTTASASNVFGSKTFGSGVNPFGGGFGATSAPSSSMFGRTPTTTASVFGAKPSFGGPSVFGGQTSSNSVFGGNQSNMQSFATAGSSGTSLFGGATSQTVFSQPTTFGTTSQSVNGPFSMSQPVQSTNSVFGTTTTSAGAAGAAATGTSGPFGAPTSSLFGASTNSAGIFGGGATALPGNSMFGSSAGVPVGSTAIGSTSIFAQPKSTAAFGGAPVFGTTSTFGTAQTAFTGFGSQPTFENPAIPAASGVFGAASTQSTTFGSNSQTTGTFGALAASPFGGVVSTTTSTPFGSSAGPFGASATSPFARNSTFGSTVQTSPETFGSALVSTGESPFAAATTAGTFGSMPAPNSQPFGTPAFGNAPSTPFASTTSTTTTSNPFAPRSQKQTDSPFGTAQTTVSSGGTFGQPSFGSITTAAIIDETAYTMEGKLTDDEKSMYLSEQFVLGKIPLNPPTIELR